ncbi:MAG: kinase/pyrophosphorylase [Alphaproteobacteria bacterium]|nr:kinase/pyrophosphorylase [Alphaproteobacteria bacterium]
MKSVHLHLVSDSTGETVRSVARACLSQFEGVTPVEHFWSLVRSEAHLTKVIAGIEAHPGPVLFTMVADGLRETLLSACQRLQVPSISVLDPAMSALAGYLGTESGHRPGRQHAMDAGYFKRIEAMNFTLAHDDGQHANDLDKADIILAGVSRTSKTPTSLYLANRGYRVANVPIVPGVPVPDTLFRTKEPLIVGLTNDPARLVQVRKSRLLSLNEQDETDYIDIERVKEEVAEARRMFARAGWPVIEVTRRSIEETAAAIITLYNQKRGTE